MVKAYNLPIDYVLYDLSYANMIMYSAVIPSYHSGKDGGKQERQKVIKADDPDNRSAVRQFLENVE